MPVSAKVWIQPASSLAYGSSCECFHHSTWLSSTNCASSTNTAMTTAPRTMPKTQTEQPIDHHAERRVSQEIAEDAARSANRRSARRNDDQRRARPRCSPAARRACRRGAARAAAHSARRATSRRAMRAAPIASRTKPRNMPSSIDANEHADDQVVSTIHRRGRHHRDVQRTGAASRRADSNSGVALRTAVALDQRADSTSGSSRMRHDRGAATRRLDIAQRSLRRSRDPCIGPMPHAIQRRGARLDRHHERALALVAQLASPGARPSLRFEKLPSCTAHRPDVGAPASEASGARLWCAPASRAAVGGSTAGVDGWRRAPVRRGGAVVRRLPDGASGFA